MRDAGKLPPEQMQCFTTPRPKEELYDIVADPHQLHNLAGDPKYAEQLAQMRAVYEGWAGWTGDRVPKNPTPDKFDRETGARLEKA